VRTKKVCGVQKVAQRAYRFYEASFIIHVCRDFCPFVDHFWVGRERKRDECEAKSTAHCLPKINYCRKLSQAFVKPGDDIDYASNVVVINVVVIFDNLMEIDSVFNNIQKKNNDEINTHL